MDVLDILACSAASVGSASMARFFPMDVFFIMARSNHLGALLLTALPSIEIQNTYSG
jgi:hypothetical protein